MPAKRKSKSGKPAHTFLDPASLPDEYAMRVVGDCLSPAIEEGAAVVCDKRLPYAAGDLVVIYMRPELVRKGELGIYVKRLVLNVPHYVKFPWRENPKSEVAALVIVEQDNPRRQYVIKADRILAMHRCLGVAGDAVRLVGRFDRRAKVAAGFTDSDVKAGPISTRREFLRVAGLAAAAVAIPAVALAADHPDAAIFAFGPRLRDLWHRWDFALSEYSRIEGAFIEAIPPKPDPVTVDPRSQKALRRWEKQRRSLKKQFGVEAAEEASIRPGDEWSDLVSEMLAVPAKTIDGLRFKLEIANDHISEFDLLETVVADVASISGPLAFWSDRDTTV